jgi:formylglycine-generating enzyme required for sulfatase activity
VAREFLEFQFESAWLDDRANIVDRRRVRVDGFIETIDEATSFQFVRIPSGEFQMGAGDGDPFGRDNEQPQHRVTVREFFIGRHPVTQSQWNAVVGQPIPLPDKFIGNELPAVNVWLELAIEFCQKLSKLTGSDYRLPSEAEWEYACRAGTTGRYNCGENLSRTVANFNDSATATGRAQPPGGTMPFGDHGFANQFGLYDMHGNVWEWCSDVWHEDYVDAPDDGRPWLINGDSGYCVQRGGSWRDGAAQCRSAFRVGDIAHNSENIVGLRVCCAG